MFEKFKAKCRRFVNLNCFIQKRIKDKLNIRGGKVEVLILYWQQLLNMVMFQATKNKDNAVISICKLVQLVPRDV